MAELRRRRDEAVEADLVELRLDAVSDPDEAGALAGRPKPVIVTCRASWEGGAFKGSEEERRRLLKAAIDGGAEYVDLEYRAHFDDLIALTGGRRIVLSSHDFDGVPVDLVARARAMRSTGAEVVKIAVKTESLSDCLALLDVRHAASGGGTHDKIVLIGMGPAGLATRVLAGRFGSAWTYAGQIAEVGQMTAAALVRDYRFRALSPSTALYGLTGFPVAHSVSPAMHNAAFEAAGLDAVYLPFPARDADDFIGFARALDLRGASVTIPFKTDLLDRMDGVDDEARRIGAINTVRREDDGTWFGRNTDAAGFLQPLVDRHVALNCMRSVVLGAGGSARAVSVALRSQGAAVTVHARNGEAAARVAGAAGAGVGTWPPTPGSWDLLINCTPLGMHPAVDTTPVPDASLRGGRLVYDLVYNPAQTRLLAAARAAGCETIGGLDMLVAQAVEQFTWWTGRRPAARVLRDAAETRLAEFNR
jgi:3-dehydroquinate dehydratase/shikimate dehydrogenase